MELIKQVVDRAVETLLDTVERLERELIDMTPERIPTIKERLHKLREVNDDSLRLLASRLGACQTAKRKLDELAIKYPL